MAQTRSKAKKLPDNALELALKDIDAQLAKVAQVIEHGHIEGTKLAVRRQEILSLEEPVLVAVKRKHLPLIEDYLIAERMLTAAPMSDDMFAELSNRFIEQASNHQRPWEDRHARELVQWYQGGNRDVKRIAKHLGRTPWACILKLVNLQQQYGVRVQESNALALIHSVFTK